MPLAPSVSNLAGPQPWLAGGEGETASELSCVSGGGPQSDPLHPDRSVHTLLELCELHLQGNHLLSLQSHLCTRTLGYLGPHCIWFHSADHGPGEEQLHRQS